MSKDYFARDALSNSGIKEILKSPAHFRYWTDNPKEDSSAFRVGRAFHMMVLEPEEATYEIAIFRETKTFNSKAGEAFLLRYPNNICVTLDEYNQASAMYESLKREEKIMSLLGGCRRELEIYGSRLTSRGAIDTKAMLDAVSQTAIFDLKTTDEPAADFEWTAKRYKYEIQAAWYRERIWAEDGVWRDFYFIVVEKKPPYGVLLYHAGDDFISRGMIKCDSACEIYAQAKALNAWPSYDTQVIRTLN